MFFKVGITSKIRDDFPISVKLRNGRYQEHTFGKIDFDNRLVFRLIYEPGWDGTAPDVRGSEEVRGRVYLKADVKNCSRKIKVDWKIEIDLSQYEIDYPTGSDVFHGRNYIQVRAFFLKE